MVKVAHVASTYGMIALLIFAGAASAEGVEPEKSIPAPWLGSNISYSNTISALTLDPSAEPDYNPYYSMTFGLAPRWRFNRLLYTALSFSLSREITQADAQTQDGEIWPSDLKLVVGIPAQSLGFGDIKLGSKLTATTPTSPVAQAQSLILGLSPSLSLSKTFKVLQGLTMAYGGSARFNFHEFTTAGRDAPTIADCRGLQCAELVNTGVRNAWFQQAHTMSISLGLSSAWSVGTNGGVYVSHLHDSTAVDGVSNTPIEGTDIRYAVSYGLELGWQARKGVALGLGAATFNPQRAPNTEFYRPYFNRYTQIYLDLRIGFDAFVPAQNKG